MTIAVKVDSGSEGLTAGGSGQPHARSCRRAVSGHRDRLPPRRAGQLEQDVYAAIAAAPPDGLTIAGVIAAVDPSLAYTTVATTVTRLTVRGALFHRRVGRAAYYRVAGAHVTVAATSTAHRMHDLLDGAPDRGDALACFLAGLAPGDDEQIARLRPRRD